MSASSEITFVRGTSRIHVINNKDARANCVSLCNTYDPTICMIPQTYIFVVPQSTSFLNSICFLTYGMFLSLIVYLQQIRLVDRWCKFTRDTFTIKSLCKLLDHMRAYPIFFRDVIFPFSFYISFSFFLLSIKEIPKLPESRGPSCNK